MVSVQSEVKIEVKTSKWWLCMRWEMKLLNYIELSHSPMLICTRLHLALWLHFHFANNLFIKIVLNAWIYSRMIPRSAKNATEQTAAVTVMLVVVDADGDTASEGNYGHDRTCRTEWIGRWQLNGCHEANARANHRLRGLVASLLLLLQQTTPNEAKGRTFPKQNTFKTRLNDFDLNHSVLLNSQ